MVTRRQQLGALALALARLPRSSRRTRAAQDFPVTSAERHHARREAGADRVALADRDRGCCSRSARASRSSPSTTSRTTRRARRARSSPASRRTSRRSPRYKPDLVVGEAGLTKLAGSFKAVGIPLLVEPSAPSLAGRLRADPRPRQGDGAPRRRRRARRADEDADRGDREERPEGRRKLSVYHELDPTYYSATSKTFIGRVYALLGLRNIADAADKSGSGYPKLSAEYIVSAEPDADRPRRHEVLRADAGEGREARRLEHDRGGQERRA